MLVATQPYSLPSKTLQSIKKTDIKHKINLINGKTIWASQAALVIKNTPANAGDIKDNGLIPGRGHGSPLQYSCLENPMDRETQWATVHRVTKTWTQLKQVIMHQSYKGAVWAAVG